MMRYGAWFYFGSVITIGVLGVGLLLWALFWDRSRGRKRCPISMTGRRVRVRPPHSHFGLLMLSSIAGVVMSIPVAGYEWLLWLLPMQYWSFGYSYLAWLGSTVNLSHAVVALIPFTIFIIWLVRQCQHPRWVAMVGAVYALSLAIFANLLADLSQPQWASYELMERLIALAAAPPIGAALALAALGIYLAIGSRVIEQDGTLCQNCAYPVARSKSARCPECGCEVSAVFPTRSEQCVACFARWGRSIAMIMIALLAAGYALVISAERDYRLLGSANYGEQWLISDVGSFEIFPGPGSPYLPVDVAGYEGVVAVVLYQRPAWRRRVVELVIGQTHEWDRGGTTVFAAEVAIVMPVPREHVDQVLRNGPPEQAIQQLVEAAASEGWRPSDDWGGDLHRIEVAWPE